tara:strand:+ start:20 stop:613 length:594 start_codon:yes stop_codon:yes gene_type:complete
MPNWCANDITIEHDDPAMLEKIVRIVNNDESEDRGLFASFVPPPDTPAYRDEYDESQSELHDDPTWWRNWNIENWGTKWEPNPDSIGWYQEKSESNPAIIKKIRLSFDTAWSPPLAFYGNLEELGYSIDAVFMEAGWGYWGNWKNGEIRHKGDLEYLVLECEDEWIVDEAKSKEKALSLGITEDVFNKCELAHIRGG